MPTTLFADPPRFVPPAPPPPPVRRRFGPADDGAKVPFEEWWNGEFPEGFAAELSRGEVLPMEVPNLPHEEALDRLRAAVYRWREVHPGVIRIISGGLGSRVPVPPFDSDRHPDLTVYLGAMPGHGRQVWRRNVPAVVAEVLSRGTRTEDEGRKADEYLLFGCAEYWLLDPDARTVRLLVRSGGQWEERDAGAGGVQTSDALPGLALDPAALFADPPGEEPDAADA